ncbi:MAG: preprotein translocase subunit SecY [Rickettsiales bacterium]
MNFGVFSRATELKKRLWFVLGALIIYRVCTYIPVPGIDPHILAEIFTKHGGGVIDMVNMLSGGGLSRMSIIALAVMPYISSSIIMQILSFAVPSLAALKKEGDAGRRKINQYTRYGTVLLATLQGYGIAAGLESMTGASGSAVMDPGMFFRFTTTVTLVGGTMFLMWLGEQITSRGIGNGISLIIFSGIVANLPSAIGKTFELGRKGIISTPLVLIIILVVFALIALIVFVERAQRRVVIQYPRRQMGNKESNHMPLKLNTAGVIPPIFASSLLLFPLTIASFNADGSSGILQTISTYLAHGQPLYIAAYVGLIVFFSFFYTSIVFNPTETADNLKKNGGFVAGVRPGQQTADYLDFILTRLTAVGALYMSLVCVMPEIFIAKYAIPFQLGGTGLLIVVNVVIDFVTQVQSHLFSHQYEGLIKKARLKGRIK